ncbi:MAG: futalosine hydrolase [Desulfovibrio sp.]|nr:futalosine hydrolase [Desulfovibrio sp.]
MNILLVSASRDELLALFPDKYKPSPDSIPDAKPLAPPKGLFGSNRVFICCTGVGPINASLSMGIALTTLARENTPPDHVLLTGLAGAHSLEQNPLRSFCLVEREIWPEYGLHDGHSVIAQAFKWPIWDNAPGGPLYDSVSLQGLEAFLSSSKQKQHFTPVTSLSVAGVSASFARANELWDRYHAELENMEGFAVAYACLRHSIPCTEVRCVSNIIGPRTPDQKDFPGALKKLGTLLSTLTLI